MIEAKFKFDNGEFEISGSEEFVTKQISEFKNILNGILSSHLQNSSQTALVPQLQAPHSKLIKENTTRHLHSGVEYADFTDIDKGLDNYSNVFEISGDRIQIISEVPGSSTAKQMINLILVYLWIKRKLNIDEVSFSELRTICEKHGAIDKANFAKHMQLQKKYFIINGSGKNQTAELTRPGVKEAEDIVEQLNRSN